MDPSSLFTSAVSIFQGFSFSVMGEWVAVILGSAGLTQIINAWINRQRTNLEVQILSFNSLQEGFEKLKKNLVDDNHELVRRMESAENKVDVFNVKLDQAETELFRMKSLVREQELKIQIYEIKIDNYLIKIREYETLLEKQSGEIKKLRESINTVTITTGNTGNTTSTSTSTSSSTTSSLEN